MIVGIVFLCRRARWWGPRHHAPHHARRESAAELLERRFAEGQISSDEYRERRSVLQPPTQT